MKIRKIKLHETNRFEAELVHVKCHLFKQSDVDT